MVALGLGISCNNCCIMCTEIMPPLNKWDLTTRQVFDRIDSMPEDVDKIGLTGGEPTIRKDIVDIIKYAKQKRPNAIVFLVTNGRMFAYRNFAEKIINAGVDEIATEIHGPTAEEHDKITRTKGSFDETVKGIKNILDLGFKNLEIRIVIHKWNYKSLPEIAKLIAKEFPAIKRVVPFPMDIIGNANMNRDKLLVKMTDIIPYLERMIDILVKNKIDVSIYHTPLCILDKKYWKYNAGKTVEDRRLEKKFCENCSVKKECAGIWKTYAFRVGTDEFKAFS